MDAVKLHQVAQVLLEPGAEVKLRDLLAATKDDPDGRLELLSMLFPGHDRRYRYNRKTQRLMQLWKEVFGPLGVTKDRVRRLDEWLRSPTPMLRDSDKDFKYVSMPEVVVSTFRGGGDSSFSSFSLRHVERLRSALSEDDATVARNMLPRLSAIESRALFLILLRCVSTHVKMASVHAEAPLFLKYKNDLQKLAYWTVAECPPEEVCRVEVHTPVRPMLCVNAGHHQLLPWMFSSWDEGDLKVVGPKSMVLAVLDDGRWMLKMTAGTKKNRYFYDLQSPRRGNDTHHIYMQRIKDAGLFNSSRAAGCVVRYVLYGNASKVVMLLQEVRSLNEDDLDQGDKPLWEGEEADLPPALKDLVLVKPVTKNKKTFTVCVDDLEQPRDKGPPELLVQTKYDGDRLQAHASLEGAKVKVSLFTKNGYDATELYSNVAGALATLLWKKRESLPCILDGEIIVTNNQGEPLPWVDGKGKYNKQQEHREEGGQIFLLDEVSGKEDMEDNDVTLLPASSKQNQLPPLARGRQGAPLPSGKLMYVAFDVLMHKDKSLMETACEERWNQLSTLFRGADKTHLMLAHSRRCRTPEEVQKQLQECVEKKWEGLVLKNPAGKVSPGLSPSPSLYSQNAIVRRLKQANVLFWGR